MSKGGSVKSLRSVRESKGVTKVAMANALGITEKTYSAYEKNPGCIKIDTAKKIGEFLSVNVSDIFFDSNSN